MAGFVGRIAGSTRNARSDPEAGGEEEAGVIRFTVRGSLASMKNRRIPLKQNPYKTIPNDACKVFLPVDAIGRGCGIRLRPAPEIRRRSQ